MKGGSFRGRTDAGFGPAGSGMVESGTETVLGHQG